MARTIAGPTPSFFPDVAPGGPQDIPGGGYQRIEATPASFGGLIGAAEEQAGARVGAGGEALIGAGIQRQDIYNQIVGDQATTNYMTGVHKKMFGDPTAPEGDPARVGLLGMDGPGAMTAARAMPGQLDQLREQIASQLPNDYVRQLFNSETRRQRIYIDQQIGAHYQTQMDKWGKQVQDDRIRSAATGAGLNYSDPEQLRQNYTTITDAAVKQVEHDIGGKIDAANPDHQARLHIALAGGYSIFAKNIVDAALAHNQPEVADKLLQDWAPWLGLPGPVQEELHRSIREPLIRSEGDAAANAVIAGRPYSGPGGGAGGPVIPYEAGALLKATGATQQQYDTYRHTLANSESQRYDEPFNPQGYGGRYGMSMKDARESAARLGIPAPTEKEFLTNPELQEKLFEAYEDTGHEEMKDIPRYANASPGQKLALLSAWHLTGGTHLKEYLETGKEYADVNGTTPSKYIRRISHALGVVPPLFGTQVAAAAPTTVPDVPPGAPVSTAIAAAAPGQGAIVTPQTIEIVSGAVPTTQAPPFAAKTTELLKQRGMTDPQIEQLRRAGFTDDRIAELDRRGELQAGTGFRYNPQTGKWDIPERAPAPAPAGGTPLSEATKATMRAGGMSEAEIARAEAAPSPGTPVPPNAGAAAPAAPVAAPAVPVPAPGAAAAAAAPSAAAVAPAPAIPPLAPIIEEHARKLEELNKIAFSTPEAEDRARQRVNEHYGRLEEMNRALAGDAERTRVLGEKDRLDRERKAADDIVSRLLDDPTKVPATDISHSPDLTTPGMKENLHDLQKKRLHEIANPEEIKDYGPAFHDLWTRVHAPAGDPNRITDPQVIYEHAKVGGDLGVAGADFLVKDIFGRRTEQGESEQKLRDHFYLLARNKITGTNEGLHMHDPKGDELFQKFLGYYLPAYEKARRGTDKEPGKTPEQLLTPGSPDYLGAVLDQPGNAYVRPLDQWFKDTSYDTPPAQSLGPADLANPDALKAAVAKNPALRSQAIIEAQRRGWIARPPPPAPAPPVAQP